MNAGTGPLSGQAAIVTGGAGGIGAASATQLAWDGAAVTIIGRTEQTLVNARREIAQAAGPGSQVHYFVGDALDPSTLAEAAQVAAARADRLSIAVSVLGGSPTFKPLVMFTPEEMVRDLAGNVVPVLVLIKAVTPLLAQGGGGSIVCISSQVAKLAWPYLTVYSAAKMGVEGLVRGAALELARLNIRVNAVRPGLVRTPATAQEVFRNQEILGRFLAEMPLGRTGIPEDVAGAVRYLAGPESSWMTGQSIGLDGGHELMKAPNLEPVVRAIHGDEAVDAALAGQPLSSRV